ncbi:MAG: anti-sigma factor family protein [Bryobacteraceae bacterium]
MDHREAVERQAAERYVLGELSREEREAFEEHFFDCPECAREVKACAAFLANARALLRERQGGLRALLARMGESQVLLGAALAACLVLVLATAYLQLVRVPALKREVAALKTPQAYAAFFLRPVVRGEDQTIALPKGAAFLGLAMDVPPGVAYPEYRCELREESGTVAAAIAARAPATLGSPIQVLLSRDWLRPGRYTLVLRGAREGASEAEVARFSFVLRLE